LGHGSLLGLSFTISRPGSTGRVGWGDSLPNAVLRSQIEPPAITVPSGYSGFPTQGGLSVLWRLESLYGLPSGSEVGIIEGI